ncbi:hypothetical protein GVAV_000927, partial [Gurleya vavrai]
VNIIENYDLRVKLPAILNEENYFRDLKEIEYNLGTLPIEEILSAEEYICFDDQFELKSLLNDGEKIKISQSSSEEDLNEKLKTIDD